MKRLFTNIFVASLAFMAANGVINAQTTIDFETVGQDWSWTLFENGDNDASLYSVVANPDMTGINASDNCAKYVINPIGAPWAGLWSDDMEDFTFNEDNAIIKLMVYKDVISPVGLKFENADGSVQFEVKVSNTVINEWEELTFDFTAQIGKSVTKFVFFPDFPATRTAGSTSYFDNIVFREDLGTGLTVPTIKDLSFAPNPVVSNLTLSANSEIRSVTLRNLSGKVVQSFLVNSASANINLQSLTTGLYIMSVELENGEITNHKISKL